jgi:hypothetical protein
MLLGGLSGNWNMVHGLNFGEVSASSLAQDLRMEVRATLQVTQALLRKSGLYNPGLQGFTR